MPRNICITAADGQTGFLIAELLLRKGRFSRQIDSVTGLAMHPSSPKCQELTSLGAKVVHHVPGRERAVVKLLKEANCDTICLIPPAHKDKLDISLELVAAAKKAGVQDVLLISSAGCDFADPQRQPRLREFIDIETAVFTGQADPKNPFLHSPCVIRAGFYAENLLLYSEQSKAGGMLSLPIGETHEFAPVAGGDIARVAAQILAGKGNQGFDEKNRGQLMVITGPVLCAGKELAEIASQELGTKLEFDNISEWEAKRVYVSRSSSDDNKKQYLLEYCSLVREGKTNYIATTAFHDLAGTNPTQPVDFFKVNGVSLRPAKKLRTGNGAVVVSP